MVGEGRAEFMVVSVGSVEILDTRQEIENREISFSSCFLSFFSFVFSIFSYSECIE